MKKAIISGSFDPITTGHVDLVRRASAIFDEVVVVVLSNAEKNCGVFTPDERLELCSAAVSAIDGASAMLWEGLTSEAAHKVGADFIVRGARSATDFDYEYELSNIMKRFDGRFETVILPASPALSMISSTYARELIKYGCELAGTIPDECIPIIERIIKERRK